MKIQLSVLFVLLFALGVQAQQPLTLGIYNKKATTGKTTCMSVYGRDFDRILSMQYSVKWDTRHLKFKEVQNFSLPKTGTTNFGYKRTDTGVLTFTWYDPKLKGISLPDGTPLYDICFDVVGEEGTKSYIKFTGLPTQIEIAMGDGVLIDLNTEGGRLDVR